MARIFRWLLWIFGVMVTLVLTGGVLVYHLASRSLPDYDRDYRVVGISGPVEIVRTDTAVPHVFASGDPDAFFGLGFAHAQDRLWQMTMMRRTAQGRLSELFGERTLRFDETLLRLGLYDAARRSVASQDEPGLAALNAYSAGVNAWLGQVNEGALGRGAPEFFLFGNEIRPWSPADSIAIVKLMSLRLTPHLADEVLRARLSLVLAPERVLDILPDAPGEGVAALPDYAALMPGRAVRKTGTDPLSPLKGRVFAGASNAWAAAPHRSASGGALLANDPHLGLSAPSIWYLARLELSGQSLIGATIPGVPLILSGRSDDLAWGITASYLDDVDLHIEELNPGDPEEYRSPDGFRPFHSRETVIRVKDSDPVEILLRWTDNGPVLPGSLFDLETVTPKNHVMSVAWTALSPNDTTVSAALELMRAKSIEEALAAGSRVIAPSQNMVIADRERIAMKTLGAFPQRSIRHASKGRIPTPGWVPANLWSGRLGYTGNPEFIDPEGGLVGTTNNKIVDRGFPYHMSYSWGDTQRVQRWRHLMQSRGVHTRDSFIEAQLDSVSFSARTLLPLVAADLWFTGEASPEGTKEGRRKQALDMLAEWNGDMNEHLPEPLIYSAWMRALQDRLIRDELGPLTEEFSHVEPVFIERVFRDVDGAGNWCDVVQSDVRETCSDMALLSLDDALLWITENHGANLETLRWGDAHEARHDHEVLGNIPLLGWLVNIRQSTSGSDNTLMRGVTAGAGENPFANVHAAGYRAVYDLADPDSSVFVIATGQSGHPLSRYYDDLSEFWRRGEYIPMSLDPGLARAAAAGITVLTPVAESGRGT